MAVDAGIDIVRHEFESLNAQTFKQSMKANSRRNVLTRKQRAGDGQHAPPHFNDDMEKKFKEIWFSEKSNPFQGANK